MLAISVDAYNAAFETSALFYFKISKIIKFILEYVKLDGLDYLKNIVYTHFPISITPNYTHIALNQISTT